MCSGCYRRIKKLRTTMVLVPVFLFLSVLVNSISSMDDVVVTLTPGQQLRGVKSSSSVDVYKFLGVPYALPPTGKLRFEPPQYPATWQGVKDATAPKTICHQFSSEPIDNAFPHSEDCLYLNVFTTDTNTSLPVMVWIHGGGFFIGSGYHDGDGSTLAPRGIVVVTINYRLGPFGFLSTNDNIMPGNYGLLDQIMALKWVQKYIHAFGGDPSQVTIAGESAGACSVGFLMLSPLAHGLFHRAIMESGSSLTLPMMEMPGTRYKVKNVTQTLGQRVGCDQSNTVAFFLCLQNVEAIKIMQAYTDMGKDLSLRYLGIPTVDKEQLSFMPEYPVHMLQKGNLAKIDTLRGYNSGEWSFRIHDPENNGVTRDEFKAVVKSALSFCSPYTAEKLSKIVEDTYMAQETDPIRLRSNLVHALADVLFASPSVLELNLTEDVTPGNTKHFLYEFDYRASDDSTPEWYGVTHAQERQFVFFNDSSTLSLMDKAVGESVQTMWSNFVKFGNPTPTWGVNQVEWKPYTKANPVMLNIDSTSQLVTFPRQKEMSNFVEMLKEMMGNLLLPDTIIIG